MEEDYNLADRYRIVRKHLDRLGYPQALSLDSLQLIERLLADFIQTTDSLKYFKTVAQDNIEACSQLQLAAESYKCDNAKLVQECNELHLNLLENKESHETQIKELKKQIRKLESDNNDLQTASSRNLKRVRELEIESAGKSSKILELQGKSCKPVISSNKLGLKKRPGYPSRKLNPEDDRLPNVTSRTKTLSSSNKIESHEFDSAEMADHRMNCLNREVTKLKEDLSLQNENVQTLKSQLATREKEIQRLKKMLEGGRPFSAVSKDCFCKKAEKCYYGDAVEMKALERAKHDLEIQLKEAMSKQHEAMSRALKLAERNEELEKELRDIDHIALAVEADCNSAVLENNRRVSRLQAKVEDLLTQVHVLESELATERRDVHEIRADLEACKLEKRNIQRVLESTLDEKKQMTDRINQLTIIEKNLNDEIDRLMRNCANQKQEIAQLECSNNVLKDRVYAVGGGGGGGGGDDRERNRETGEKIDKNKGKKILKKKTAPKVRSLSPNMKPPSSFHKENEVSKDVPNHVSRTGSDVIENQKSTYEKDGVINTLNKTIERLQTERDYYRIEYNKFREQFNMISEGDNADLWTQTCELRHQLNEKEQAIAQLQREKKELAREKHNLEARLDTSNSQQRKACILCSPRRPLGPCNCPSSSPPSGGDATSAKSMLERLEKERNTARADVERLIEERDALRERLKMAVDAHTSEQRRLREDLSQAESRIKQLETERQDLLMTQGTRRATINGLEDQLEDVRQELRKTKEELTTQRTQYFQLRALQEQTDQALGDVQGQLSQSETELNKMVDHNRNVEQQQKQLVNQVKELKQECNMLRSNLGQLDQEKDQLLINLDEKTERIAGLEREIRFKEQEMHDLEQQVIDFQRKYQICVDQTAEQERQLRAMEVEMNDLQRQLTSVTTERENVIRENSRIQDDLAAVTCECRNLQRELEESRAESYDLKRQLQTYVAEVRRAEDLLNRKENERSEMLNHFRSLSLEATVLENNNQSLESEAAEARGALQTAQDRLLDLERKIADRDCLISGYETQITELTQNVASMETQLQQQGDQRMRAETDLNAVRDLCVQLDQQKESLEQQLRDKEAMRAQCEAQLTRLRTDQSMVQDQLHRDNAAVDRLEALLSQARQESINNQAVNQELQSEISRLKQRICELQNKLHAESAELRRYQNQAAEYSKQISELRRQMTNERFDRARKEEENRSLAPKSCAPCSPCRRPTPALRPDPKSVNNWKSPAPSYRMQKRVSEDNFGILDLKRMAQRTNRFNSRSAYNLLCPNMCSCEGITSKISNDHSCETDCVACIKIILDPTMKEKIEVTDKCVQIVDVTSLIDNNGDTVNPCTSRMQNRMIDSGMDSINLKPNIVKEIEDKNIQTESCCETTNAACQSDPVATEGNLVDRSSGIARTNTEVQCGDSSLNTNNSTSKETKGTSLRGNDLLDVVETLFWPLHSTTLPNKDRVLGADENKTRLLGKLSDRIKEMIDHIEIENKHLSDTLAQINATSGIRRNHTRTEDSNLLCNDACKEILSKNLYSNVESNEESNSVYKSGGMLPSLISNNPSIPKISLNTTDTVTRMSPTNQWSSVSDTEMYSDLMNIAQNESLQSLRNNNVTYVKKTKDVNEPNSCEENRVGVDDFAACGTKKIKFTRHTRGNKDENLDGSTSTTSGYWSAEADSVRTENTQRSNGKSETASSFWNEKNVKQRLNTNVPINNEDGEINHCVSSCNSLEAEFDYSLRKGGSTISSNQMNSLISKLGPRNIIKAKDFTRPEFLRMLTEIKEHTCSLECQLSAMNDALKKKQASRNKLAYAASNDLQRVIRSNYIPGKFDTFVLSTNEATTETSSKCCSKKRCGEDHTDLIRNQVTDENLMESSCCDPVDESGLKINNEEKDNDVEINDCCTKSLSKCSLDSTTETRESIPQVRDQKTMGPVCENHIEEDQSKGSEKLNEANGMHGSSSFSQSPCDPSNNIPRNCLSKNSLHILELTSQIDLLNQRIPDSDACTAYELSECCMTTGELVMTSSIRVPPTEMINQSPEAKDRTPRANTNSEGTKPFKTSSKSILTNPISKDLANKASKEQTQSSEPRTPSRNSNIETSTIPKNNAQFTNFPFPFKSKSKLKYSSTPILYKKQNSNGSKENQRSLYGVTSADKSRAKLIPMLKPKVYHHPHHSNKSISAAVDSVTRSTSTEDMTDLRLPSSPDDQTRVIPSHDMSSNQLQPLSTEPVLTKLQKSPGEHVTYIVSTHQTTPFLLNSFNNSDFVEEEMNTTNYEQSRFDCNLSMFEETRIKNESEHSNNIQGTCQNSSKPDQLFKVSSTNDFEYESKSCYPEFIRKNGSVSIGKRSRISFNCINSVTKNSKRSIRMPVRSDKTPDKEMNNV